MKILLVALGLAALLSGCGSGADSDISDGEMNGGRWEQLDARGLGVPAVVGDEVIAISAPGDDRVEALAYDVAAGRKQRVAPSPLPWRTLFTAIASDREVLVWGGDGPFEGPPGAAYNPRRGAWSTIPRSPVPVPFRHTAVWSGEEMLIWGGLTGGDCNGPVNARPVAYDPEEQSWRRLRKASMGGRVDHVAVWTGEQMLVWGGTSKRDGLCEPTDRRSDGAAFDPARNEWTRIPEAPIPWLEDSNAAWTGDELLVWNGRAVALYDPDARRWRVASPPPLEEAEPDPGPPRLPPAGFPPAPPMPSPPVARVNEAFAWTGSELIIWGGRSSRESVLQPYDDGAAYDPATDEWSTLPGAPGEISPHQIAIWHDGWLYVLAQRGWARYRPAP